MVEIKAWFEISLNLTVRGHLAAGTRHNSAGFANPLDRVPADSFSGSCPYVDSVAFLVMWSYGCVSSIAGTQPPESNRKPKGHAARRQVGSDRQAIGSKAESTRKASGPRKQSTNEFLSACFPDVTPLLFCCLPAVALWLSGGVPVAVRLLSVCLRVACHCFPICFRLPSDYFLVAGR